MPNRILGDSELKNANALLETVRLCLKELGGEDNELLFAYRRKIYKELTYDERGKLGHRRKLKEKKWKEQRGICALCPEPLPESGAELDRIRAADGYTSQNTRLIHHECHRKQQAARRFT